MRMIGIRVGRGTSCSAAARFARKLPLEVGPTEDGVLLRVAQRTRLGNMAVSMIPYWIHLIKPKVERRGISMIPTESKSSLSQGFGECQSA